MEKIKLAARMRLLRKLGYVVYNKNNKHLFKFADDEVDITDINDGTITDIANKVRQGRNQWAAEQFIYSFCPMVKNLSVGVYWFNYEAKLGELLDVWDQNPLSIIYESHTGIDGINYYGSNVHFINSNSRREAVLQGATLSNKEQIDAFKDYINDRAYNIFEIPEQYFDIACLTQGKFVNNRR